MTQNQVSTTTDVVHATTTTTTVAQRQNQVCLCCGSISSLVEILVSFVSNSFSIKGKIIMKMLKGNKKSIRVSGRLQLSGVKVSITGYVSVTCLTNRQI